MSTMQLNEGMLSFWHENPNVEHFFKSERL